MPPARRASARTRILDAADRLFSEQGIRVVGVEAIVAAADTAKTTLYAHFGSKDGVVVAYLQRRAEQQRARLEQAQAAHRGSAVERVLHLYDLLAVEVAEPGYRGSPFANVRVELGGEHPAAAVAREHRQRLLDAFTALATAAAAPDPAALAAQLLLLHDAAAQAGGEAAQTARTAAERLLTAPTTRALTATTAARAADLAPSGPPEPHAAPEPHRPAPTPPPAVATSTSPNPGQPAPTTPPADVSASTSPDIRQPAPTTPAAGVPAGGSAEAHRLVAFLNSAHLPDGDDQLADERAGAWLSRWLADAARAAPARVPTAPAATALLALREGLRQLAAVNCGAQADPTVVAEAQAVLRRAPLLLDLAGGSPPRLAPADGGDARAVAADPAADPAPNDDGAGGADADCAAADCAAADCAAADCAAADCAAAGCAVADPAPDADGGGGDDACLLAIAAAAEAYLAVRARGEWQRLKVCGSPDCRWAFVDGTRNRSRRWCDMAGCGNRAKNRAWRRRQTPVTS